MTKNAALAVLGTMAIVVALAHAEESGSIHSMSRGTVVRDSFRLVGKTVPLPEGEFVFAATRVRDATRVKGEWIRQRVQLVTVYLAQIEGDVLRAEVLATTVLDPSFTYSKWEDEPCGRGDTLFRQDLAQNKGYQQNCLLVNHVTGIYTREPPGIYADAYAWLQQRAVRLPVDVVIEATATRIEVGERLAAVYRFNPAAFGCAAGRNPSWATSDWHRNALANDPERVRFVESVVEWGKFAQAQLDDEVHHGGRGSARLLAPRAVHRC